MKPACRRPSRRASGVIESPASVVSRKYLYTGNLSFSACLAENPDPFLFLPREPVLFRLHRLGNSAPRR